MKHTFENPKKIGEEPEIETKKTETEKVDFEKPIENAEEIKNNLLRENFVKTQLELENLRKSGEYSKDIHTEKIDELQRKYDEAKKSYYRLLEKKEGKDIEQKSKFVSEEFNKLQDIKIDLRSKEEAKNAYFPFNKIKEIGNWYRKQPTKQKLIVAGALIGGGVLAGISGGVALGGAVSAMALVSRILSGAGTAVVLETAIAQGKGKKFGMQIGHKGLMEEKTAEEIERIKNGLTVESASKFFEENEEALATASERLYKKSKKLETERAIIAGAMGAVVGTGALRGAIKNVIHETGVGELIKNFFKKEADSVKVIFNWGKEHLGLGGHEAVKVAGTVGSSHVAPNLNQHHMPAGNETAKVDGAVSPETHRFVGEIKAGGDVDHTAFEVGKQAGISHDQVREALKNSHVTDIHGHQISLLDSELVQPGVEMEFVPGTVSQPGHFIVTEPSGVGSGGFASHDDYMKIIQKTHISSEEVNNRINNIYKYKWGPFHGSQVEEWQTVKGLKANDVMSGKFGHPVGNGLDTVEIHNREQMQEYLKELQNKLHLSIKNNETVEEFIKRANKIHSLDIGTADIHEKVAKHVAESAGTKVDLHHEVDNQNLHHGMKENFVGEKQVGLKTAQIHHVPQSEAFSPEKVEHIEAQFNKDNAALLGKIPSGLKESLIDSSKIIDLSRIEPEFNKLDFEHQNNILKFINEKVINAHVKAVGETAVLSEKLSEHLSQNHSYLKNMTEFFREKAGFKFDAGVLSKIKNMSIDDLQKSIKTMALPRRGWGFTLFNPHLGAYESLSDFMKEQGFKGGKQKIFEVLGRIATNLRNK